MARKGRLDRGLMERRNALGQRDWTVHLRLSIGEPAIKREGDYGGRRLV